MKLTEFFKKLIESNSGYSSKRFCALVLLASGIIIPVICLFMEPIGVIDDSVVMFALQLLAAGCGLLGFTLGEKYRSPITKNINENNGGDYDTDLEITSSSTRTVRRRPYGIKCNDEDKEG